jgi:hypothetical protein
MQNKNNKHTLLSIQDIEMNTYYLLMNNDKLVTA